MATSITAAFGGPEPTRLPNRVRGLRLTRVTAFWLLLVAYLLFTLAVIFRTPVLSIDQFFVDLRLIKRYPGAWHDIHTYVMLGQRRPSTKLFLPFFVWAAWRMRSPRPLVMLATALILLNASVGVVKFAIGRLGPRGGHAVHDVFVGGDIYPSGHVSNAVVLYGLMAMIAWRYRRLAAVLAVFLSVTVALGTIYLNTHWFSDLVGAWMAGGLVLLAVPSVMPVIERPLAQLVEWAKARRERKYPLLAVVGLLTLVGLGYVYFNIDWFTELGLIAVGVMGVLCLPAFVPVLVSRLRRPRRATRPISADAPTQESIPDRPADETAGAA